MHALDDNALLREYVERDSAPAFAELVARHVDKVYSTALRHTRNPHQAEEITQAVFVILAQKARKLGRHVILTGWLYQTARLTALTFLRSEIRRNRREQETLMQSLPNETESDVWPHIAPLLDDALAKLGEKDRHAVVLRFFDGKSFGEVGSALGGSESAAKMRVSRALEKLRKFFAKRGVKLTAVAIAGAVSANSIHAAPVGLAKAISAVAVAKSAAVSTSTLTLIKGALKLMAWTKMKITVGAVAGLILATSVSVVIVQSESRIQGMTEDEWIKSIVYFGDDQQRERWHALGNKGIKMLLRAMQPPSPRLTEEQALASRDTRMRAGSLLCQLADYRENVSAVPNVIKLLKTEKDGSVRGLELAYFEMPIQSMPAKDKTALLPELIRSTRGHNSSERHNALVSLQYYANQKETVVPLIVNAMQDSDSGIRVMAIKALNNIDPQNPASSNFSSILAECITQLVGNMPSAANDAVIQLGNFHRDPAVSVPALVHALQSGDRYVRANAAVALGKFGSQAKSAVPALQQALQDGDAGVRRQADAALKLIALQ